MAKKSTKAKPTADNKQVSKTEEEKRAYAVKLALKKASKGWSNWKDLKTWEKVSKVPALDWKKKVLSMAFSSIDKAFKNNQATVIDALENADEKFLLDLLYGCYNRIYISDYIKNYKKAPQSAGSSMEYLLFVVRGPKYFDWGLKKYNAALEEYNNGTSQARKMLEEDKLIKFKRDSGGKVLEVVPQMGWGTTLRAIPKHAYVGDAYVMAMPVEEYMAAIEEDASKGEDDVASKHWDTLMPAIIELSSDVPNNVHYGDPESSDYINLVPGKCYRGSFFCKRGQKIVIGDKTIYAFEGEVKESEITDPSTGEITKKTLYSGPRSFQYNLGPSRVCGLQEISAKEFDAGYGDTDYFYEQMYSTWASSLIFGENIKRHGLANVPIFFRDYNYKSSKKRERRDALNPVAFEATVLEVIVNKSKEDDPNQYIARRLRLDDNLDSKFDDDTNFTEITVSCNSLSEELTEKFDTLAEGSRIRMICTISQATENDLLQGDCIWFDIKQSNAVGDGILNESFYDVEETDVEMSLLDDDLDDFDAEEEDEEEFDEVYADKGDDDLLDDEEEEEDDQVGIDFEDEPLED